MKLVRKILKIIISLFYKIKCYQSINDLPAFNWWQIHETNDLSYLLITKKNINRFEKLFLNTVWTNLYDQYFKAFGLGDHFIDVLEKKRYIRLLKCDRWIEGDKSIETLIKIAELELAEIEKINGGDFLETKTYIEKILSFQIDLKKTSVAEFYTYLKIAIKQTQK